MTREQILHAIENVKSEIEFLETLIGQLETELENEDDDFIDSEVREHIRAVYKLEQKLHRLYQKLDNRERAKVEQ